MTDIIVFAGAKQSGKSSAGNFLTGFTLCQIARRNPGLPMPTKFDITDNGDLVVNATFQDQNGEYVVDNGILDLNRRDYSFAQYADQYVWPYIKCYAFADTLKDIAMHVFGLTYEQCYGTNEQKNTYTNVDWYDIIKVMPRQTKYSVAGDKKLRKKLTAREFMQVFGTQICRTIYDDCWIESCFRRIQAESPPIAVIVDCRFPNEVEYCKNNGARVIKLTRDPFKDDAEQHESESLLREVPDVNFDYVLDNNNITIIEKNQLILDKMYEWGTFKGFVE